MVKGKLLWMLLRKLLEKFLSEWRQNWNNWKLKSRNTKGYLYLMPAAREKVLRTLERRGSPVAAVSHRTMGTHGTWWVWRQFRDRPCCWKNSEFPVSDGAASGTQRPFTFIKGLAFPHGVRELWFEAGPGTVPDCNERCSRALWSSRSW